MDADAYYWVCHYLFVGDEVMIEFIKTYGWAILVVLVAIGSLAYFDVPERLLCDSDFCVREASAENVSFCSLCTNFWVECQDDSSASQRFRDECVCVSQEFSPLASAILNFSDEVLIAMPGKIPSGLYESHERLTAFAIRDLQGMPCVSAVEKVE